MAQVPPATMPATTYPLHTPVDIDKHLSTLAKERVWLSDQNLWLQVTDIPIPPETRPPSELVLTRFCDTDDVLKGFLLGMPPIRRNTARIYDHLILKHLKLPKGHNIHHSSTINSRLREHLSDVTGRKIETWRKWNVETIPLVVDPYQTYVVRDQWASNLQTQVPDNSAVEPMMITAYDYEQFHIHRTMLQFFPIQGDSLISKHPQILRLLSSKLIQRYSIASSRARARFRRYHIPDSLDST